MLAEIKKNAAEFKEVKICSDDDGHQYILPAELHEQFCLDLDDEDLTESGEFDTKYGQYRTGGCLSNFRLYCKI
jgi:hypothetical protein